MKIATAFSSPLLHPNIDTIRHWLYRCSCPLSCTIFARAEDSSVFSFAGRRRVILVERIWVENEWRPGRGFGRAGPKGHHPLTLSPQLLSKWLHVFNDNPKLEHMSSMERDQILFQEMTLVQKKDIFQIEIAST